MLRLVGFKVSWLFFREGANWKLTTEEEKKSIEKTCNGSLFIALTTCFQISPHISHCLRTNAIILYVLLWKGTIAHLLCHDDQLHFVLIYRRLLPFKTNTQKDRLPRFPFFLNNWTLRFVWFAGNLIVITILCVCVLPLYHKELVVAPPESVSACSLTASSFSMLRFFYSFRVGRQSILRAAANKSEAPIWPGPPPISSNAFLRLLFCLRIALAWLFPLISIMQSLQIDIRGNLDRNALT